MLKLQTYSSKMQGNSDINVSLATLIKYFVSKCYDTGSTTGAGTF